MKIKLSRIATLGAAVSIIYTIIGVLVHEPPVRLHPSLAGLGGLLLFPTSMYIVFTGSLKSGRPREGPEALAPVLAVLFTGIAPLAGYLAGITVASAAAALGLTALLAHVAFQVQGWRRPEPRLLLFYPPAAGLAGYMLAAASPGAGVLMPPAVAGLVYSASMIYVVSLYTIARNYGVTPRGARVYVPFLAHAPSVSTVYKGGIEAMIVAAALSGLVYMLAMGYPHRIPYVAKRAGRLREPARSSLYYMLASHTVAFVSLVLALAAVAGGDGLAGLHYVTLGFAGAHILLHAPLMLPQVTGVVLKKDYRPLPPLLVLASAIARDVIPWASTLLVVLAFVEALVQFRPLGLVARR